MSIILITGAGGYIGRSLARALRARGAAVRGLDRDGAALETLVALGVEPLVADAGDASALAAALKGVEVVYHLAGSALGNPATIRRSNVGGAEALAAACAGRRLRAMVFASSGALYPSGSGWLTEETPPAPAFHYARAKAEAERVLMEAYRRDGTPMQIARIAAVYGPDSPALMVEQVRRGRFPLIGGGKGYASNIHLDDLIEALLAMPERGQAGRIYNLADDRPAPIREFYNYLAALLGAPPPPSMHPLAGRALVRLLGIAGRLRRRPNPLPVDLVAMASVSHRMTNRRMREELGMRLRYPSYREGLPAALGVEVKLS
jgi:nucleoside-diphosphate-sugar epimerase